MRFEVRCFPRTDDQFVDAVRRQFSELELRLEPSSLPDALRSNLTADYPVVDVRVADALATGPERVVLYVFRDGSLLEAGG
jgi:hypothetical protein